MTTLDARRYSRRRIFVGYRRDGSLAIFRDDREPSADKYGTVYLSVLGPFRTRRAADLCVSGNVPFQVSTVAEYERIARGGRV